MCHYPRPTLRVPFEGLHRFFYANPNPHFNVPCPHQQCGHVYTLCPCLYIVAMSMQRAHVNGRTPTCRHPLLYRTPACRHPLLCGLIWGHPRPRGRHKPEPEPEPESTPVPFNSPCA